MNAPHDFDAPELPTTDRKTQQRTTVVFLLVTLVLPVAFVLLVAWARA